MKKKPTPNKSTMSEALDSYPPEHIERTDLASLIDRIKATIFDQLVVVGLIVLFSQSFDFFGYEGTTLRLIALFIVLMYEPIMVSLGGTLGQRTQKITVKKASNEEKNISILSAFVRYLLKVLLGVVSLFTVSFNPEKKAIHDLLSGSIVLYKSDGSLRR